jgi:hypothetical protein
MVGEGGGAAIAFFHPEKVLPRPQVLAFVFEANF